MIFAYLKYDKWYFIKTCGKAKYEAPPDLKITQFQGREIFTPIRSFPNIESTFFTKLKTFDRSEYIKVIKLQNIFTPNWTIHTYWKYIFIKLKTFEITI